MLYQSSTANTAKQIFHLSLLSLEIFKAPASGRLCKSIKHVGSVSEYEE